MNLTKIANEYKTGPAYLVNPEFGEITKNVTESSNRFYEAKDQFLSAKNKEANLSAGIGGIAGGIGGLALTKKITSRMPKKVNAPLSALGLLGGGAVGTAAGNDLSRQTYEKRHPAEFKHLVQLRDEGQNQEDRMARYLMEKDDPILNYNVYMSRKYPNNDYSLFNPNRATPSPEELASWH